MQKETVRSLITRLYVDGDTILGSALGALLRRHFSELFEQYSKLSQLIEKEATGLLVLSGKTGYDNIYRVRFEENKTKEHARNSTPVDFTNPVARANLWRIFCNPKERGNLWIRNIDKGLLCSDESLIDDSQKEPLTALNRLTHDDVNSIIHDFYTNHLATSKNTTGLPTSERYWRDWTSHLRLLEHTPSHHGLVQLWWSYYQYRVEFAFIVELRKNGFSPKDIERSVKILNASRGADRQDTPTKTTALTRNDSMSLRELVVSVIEQLTDEEVAKISLPVGIITNVSNRSK